MKKLNGLIVASIMLLGAVLITPNAFAATGNVSVNGGVPYSVPSSQTTLSVPIQISGSDGFNSFDIQVSADPTILNAAGGGVSLTGSVLTNSPTIVLECINGVLIVGTTCSTNDGPGVVHFAVTQNTLTCTTTGCTTSGTLFTISYSIVGSTTGTPISFTTGCTKTSTGTSDCVTVANGNQNGVPASETDQGTTFANLIDFTMTPAHSKLSTPSGMSISDVINYASEGGYTDNITQTCTATSGLTCSPASTVIDLIDFTSTSSTISVVGTVSGSVTVTGTGQGIISSVKTHSVTIPVAIQSPGFSVSLASSVTIPRGSSDSSTSVNLQGFGGFSGSVSFTASATDPGITASAPTSTLTNDGSGYSTASPALTISVASTVATGNYTLTVTGTSGTTSHSASMTVSVPGKDFKVVAVPNAITTIRGGTLASELSVTSLANFAGTVSFSAAVSPVPGQQDSCCFTNNTVPGFSPTSVTLGPGGSADVSFTIATVGGSSPASSYTATGNYTVTVTATSPGLSHSLVVTFNIIDFAIGPAFCPGNNFVQTSPDSYDAGILTNTTTPHDQLLPDGTTVILPYTDIAGQTIGSTCNSITITAEPNVQFPYLDVFSNPAPVLFVQATTLGGLFTDGFGGLPSVSSINPALPFNGITVPQLASVVGSNVGQNKACMVPTFWPNGTQIPYSYLAQNGPLILPSSGFYPFLGVIGATSPNTSHWGCRFDMAVYPNDQGNQPELNNFENTHCPSHGPGSNSCGHFGACPPNFDSSTPCDYENIHNPDFWGVTAMALQGTLPGDYTFLQCGQDGVIRHCNTYTLIVLPDPAVHQLVVKKSTSFSASGGQLSFKIGVSNPSTTHTIYVQVTATGSGNFGDTFTASSGVVAIAPNAAANNIALSAPLSASEIGETFTFSFTISVGTDPTQLSGTSSAQTIQQTIHITP